MTSFDSQRSSRPASGGGWRGSARLRTAPSRRGRSRVARGGGQGSARAPHLGDRWKTRAGSDAEVASLIAARCGDAVNALSERTAAGGRITLDHLVVAASGVWVVASEPCRGRVELVEAPLRGARLMIGGVDRTELAAGLAQKVAAVERVLCKVEPLLQVRGALCLVTPKGFVSDPGLPLLRPLTIGGLPLLTPERLVKLLLTDGLLSRIDRARLARAAGQQFPARSGR